VLLVSLLLHRFCIKTRNRQFFLKNQSKLHPRAVYRHETFFPFTRSYVEIKRQARENAARAKPLSPTIDFVFKTLFSGKDEDSREALRLLLSSCIHRQVRDLRLQNTEIIPAFLLGKVFRETFGLLDVHVTFNDGEQADIEMQVNRSDDDLKARSLLYASRLLESQLGRGERFGEAKRVYVIFFWTLSCFPIASRFPGATPLWRNRNTIA
jgi:hypothetical protein